MQTDDERAIATHGHRVALNDFSHADAFAALLIKRKWFGRFYAGVSAREVQQLALCTAFVVTYARPFSDNDRWKFRIKGCGLDAAQRALHSRLVDLRNEVFAHSDAKHHDYRVHESGSLTFGIITTPAMHLDEDTLTQARSLLQHLKKVAWSRLEASGAFGALR
jgi:hypothetical protein